LSIIETVEIDEELMKIGPNEVCDTNTEEMQVFFFSRSFPDSTPGVLHLCIMVLVRGDPSLT